MSFAVGAAAPSSLAGFRHSALLCKSSAECARSIRAFVEEGVASGQPVLMVATTNRMQQLPGLSVVDFRDVRVAGRNPARLIPLLLRYYAEVPSTRGVRVVIEPLWPGRTAAEVEEVLLHEALSNLALAGLRMSVLCVYHALDLGAGVRVQIGQCHHGDSPGDPEEWTGWAERELPPAPKDAETVKVGRASLATIRHLLRRRAIAEGLRPDRAGDLVLAANEVATNSVVHGPGAGEMRLWTERSELVCDFHDEGWIADPLIGRHPPAENALGQRGLWMVNQLCDLVQIRSGPKGTTVRLRVSCAPGLSASA